MKTVLIYTSPARGHLYPIMDVAIELKKNGYKVIVQTLSKEKENVEKENIQHIPISPDIESLELQDFKENNAISQFRSAFRSWLSRAPHEIADLRSSCNKYNPDLLIVDVNTWGAGAFAAGVPVCVVPWGRDQSETARRVEVSGAGTMLPRNKLNEKQLREAIQGAMNCSKGASNIAKAFKESGGAKRAVKAIFDM